MQIMGAKIENPVQWVVTNVAGTAIPAYDLADSPWGELPSYVSLAGWSMLGLVVVRLVALVVLAVARHFEEVTK